MTWTTPAYQKERNEWAISCHTPIGVAMIVSSDLSPSSPCRVFIGEAYSCTTDDLQTAKDEVTVELFDKLDELKKFMGNKFL